MKNLETWQIIGIVIFVIFAIWGLAYDSHISWKKNKEQNDEKK